MSSRFAKTLAAVATIAAVAVPTAQARQGADDPVGHEHQGQVVVTAGAAKQKVHKHKHRHGRRHVRKADDNLRNRARGADDNAPRGGGADDPVGHR